MSFNSKYKSSEIEKILDSVGGKVDKVSGKQLSTEDFTSALKTKLEGLSNYDDTELSEALLTLRGDFDKLVSGDTTTAIKTFNEVIAFLDGVQDTQDLSSIIASIEQQIAGKMDKVTLATVATSGSYNDLSNKPTIEEDGETFIIGDGIISSNDEYFYLPSSQTENESYILATKADIPASVTESTVSGWGFTKNTGTVNGVNISGTNKYPDASGIISLGSLYSKPSYGIPKTDLASAVQTSLGKADTALQSYTEQYKGTVTGVKVNGSTKSPSSGTVDIGNVVTSVKINGNSKSPSSGVVDLGTVITSHQTLKTINGQSIVGSGDITIQSGGAEVDNIYITDFTVNELYDLIANPHNVIQASIIELQNAITAHKVVLVPYDTNEGYNGYGVATGYMEDLLYVTITIDNGRFIDIELSINSTDIRGQEVRERVWDNKQDTLVSGTNIKTINGESILGSGNIEISGGSLSGSGAYAEVNHGTSDTTFTLTPNTFHVWDEVRTLWLTFGDPIEGVVNEYIFQFSSPNGGGTELSLPGGIMWPGDSGLVIEEAKTYIVSIVNKFGVFAEYSLSISGTDPA